MNKEREQFNDPYIEITETENVDIITYSVGVQDQDGLHGDYFEF